MIVGAQASQVTDQESEVQKPSDTFKVTQQVMTRRALTPRSSDYRCGFAISLLSSLFHLSVDT